VRRGITVGVMVALAFAAMVIGAFGVLLESGIRVHAPVDRYQKVAAVVSARQSVTLVVGSGDGESTQTLPLVERARVRLAETPRLRAIPGVTSVVADLSFPVMTTGGATLTAHGWDSAAATGVSLTSGSAPSAPDEVVLDTRTAAQTRARVGSSVKLQTNGEPQTYRVSGIAQQAAATGTTTFTATATATAYFAQQEAAVLSGHPDSADALLVLADHGLSAQALQDAAPGLVVSTGNARGDVEDLAVAAARADVIAIGASLGGIALMVAILVVTGLLELSVRERSRELAVLRAVGAMPRQVRRMIVRETLRMAVPAAIAGGVLSLGLGALLHAAMSSRGVLPTGFALALSPLPVAGSALITIGAAVGAAWLASRRVSRIRPVEALGETAVEPAKLPKWRIVTGSVFLVLGLATAALTLFADGQVASASAGGLVISLIWGAALLGPAIARVAVRALGLPLRVLSPITGRLAAIGARAAAVRMATVTTPIALAIGFSAAQLGVQSTMEHVTQIQAAAGIRADQVLVSSGPGVPHAAYDEVRATPGVTGVSAIKRTTVLMTVSTLGDPTLESLTAQGIEGSTATLDPLVATGSLAALTGDDTVALSSDVAGGTQVGQTTKLWLGDGTVINPKVVAVYDRGLGFGDVLLPRDLAAQHATSQLDDYLLVAGHADLSGVATVFAGLHATTKADYVATLTEQAKSQGLVSEIAVLAIAGFIIIGMVTTLAVSTAARRREFALLRLIGATRTQVLRMLWLETAIVLGTGLTVGALVAGITLGAFAGGVTGTLAVPASLVLGLIGAVAVPGALAVMLPARSVVRRGSPRIG